MQVIVTGGCGFIGSNLVDKLVANGDQVTVVDNLATGYIKNLNPQVQFINADIRQNLIDYSGLQGEVIYHLAALARIQPSFKRPHETLQTNSEGTARVLDLARYLNAKVVYAGSSSFYADPHKNPYAHSKWVGEEHCKMYNQVYGVSTAIARFFNVYGPRQEQNGENAAVLGIFERQRKAGQALTVTGTGQKRRDFTHVEDICDGLIRMSQQTWNGEIFNLGRGKNHSINEVAMMFEPDDIQYIAERPGEAEETLADLSFTYSALSWTPQRNLEDYVKSFLESL